MTTLKLFHKHSMEKTGDGMPRAGDLAATVRAPRSWAPLRLVTTLLAYLTGRVGALGHTRAGGLEAPVLRTVQRGIARELSRARRFERPLSVLVLRTARLETTGIEAAVRIALQRLRDTDLWFHEPVAGQLVVVAPETGREAAQILARRLVAGLSAGNGVTVSWATATFPSDGLTFEVLYETCMERIARRPHERAVQAAM